HPSDYQRLAAGCSLENHFQYDRGLPLNVWPAPKFGAAFRQQLFANPIYIRRDSAIVCGKEALLKTIFQPLLVLLAKLTDQAVAHQLKTMAQQLQFIKADNDLWRARLPKRIVVTARVRRRLIRLGKPLGPAIKDLITIVTPATLARKTLSTLS